MSFIPTAEQLHGYSLERAECYGKPHVMSRYVGSGVNNYKLDDNANCCICGKPATNSHHLPPKGYGIAFVLPTKMGQFVLRPALLSVCGSGTTGCHGLIHNKVITVKWVWDEDEYAEAWWDGTFLSHGIKPHSEQLYEYGHWEVRKPGQIMQIRN